MPGSPLGLGDAVLHGGVPPGSTADVALESFLASVALVGVVGGGLYWYYLRRLRAK